MCDKQPSHTRRSTSSAHAKALISRSNHDELVILLPELITTRHPIWNIPSRF